VGGGYEKGEGEREGKGQGVIKEKGMIVLMRCCC